MQIVHPLKPIFDKNSEVLILGSMPSITSREKGFYYAHPQNRFWPILEHLFNESLSNFEEKTNFLLKNHIALWDTFKLVDIHSSNDASIKKYELNNIESIIKESNIKVIFCTGKVSFNAMTKSNIKLPLYYLPSPSSANASQKLKDLIKEYKIILNYLSK